jgi:hypothetical protein
VVVAVPGAVVVVAVHLGGRELVGWLVVMGRAHGAGQDGLLRMPARVQA